jgi:uracil-DNA glycosylase
VFKELQRDLRVTLPTSGHLGRWADRGVLLLNTCLTVEASSPASHAKYGWQALTDMIISTPNDRAQGLHAGGLMPAKTH